MRTINKTKIAFGFLIISLIIISVIKSVDLLQRNNDSILHPQYSVETFKTGDNAWGYNIFKGKTLIIRQDIVPAFEEIIPFQNKNDARKIGLLVIEKLKNRKLPTITRSELERLKVNVNLMTEH